MNAINVGYAKYPPTTPCTFVLCATNIFRALHRMFPDTRILRVTKKNIENLNKYAGRPSERFRPQWLENHSWLQEVPNDMNAAFCIVCKQTIPAHLGKISRHAESKMHRDRSGKNEETNRSDTNLNMPTDASLLSFDERKKVAEIRLAAFVAEKNIPQTAKEMLSLFQHIGEDPNVLKSMTISRTKCQKIISNVLYPVETERIVDNIKNTKFSIFIDETSDITNDKWMTFLVRYVDSDTLDTRSQLVKLIDIDASDSSADKLFNAFRSEMYKLQIPFENILALTCDNASVMTEKHVSFRKKLEEKCKNLITFACPCHSAALAAHAASNKMPAFCDEFLRKMVNFINSSPKRSAIFKDFCDCFQDTSHKLLKLCDTRWLTHYSCVDRILESWDTLKHFLTEIVVSEKTQSGEYLLTLIQKLDIKAYFLFLKYVLNFFNAFNAFFQAEETRIHLLHSKSVNFLMQICKNFLKPELLANLLIDIKFSEHDNHKPIDDIDLGSECEEYLLGLHKEGHADVIANIRQNCLNFYVTAAEEIKKRLPLTNKFLYKLQTFLPRIALLDDNREKSFLDVSFIAKTFGGFDENDLKEDWIALYQDFTIDEKLHLSKLNFDCMWKEILKRQSDNIAKYPHFKLLLNAIRSLPNSNADLSAEK